MTAICDMVGWEGLVSGEVWFVLGRWGGVGWGLWEREWGGVLYVMCSRKGEGEERGARGEGMGAR